MPVPTLPDTVALVRDALLGQTPVTALVSTRVYDRIPDGTPTFPLLVVNTVTETEAEWHTLEALVQVDVWGAGPSSDDEQAARVIVRALAASTRDLRGVWASGTVRSAALDRVIVAPDPDNGRARFVVTLAVETMP